MSLDSILEKVREIAVSISSEETIENDLNPRWMEKTMRALQAEKITGLMVPQNAGGHGEGFTALVKTCEALGIHGGSAGLCFGMHCVGTAVLAAKATEFQKQNFLVPIAEGKHITTLALSEPGTGAHFYFPQTALAQDGNDYLVNGKKTFITNGSFADSYVISTVAAQANDAEDKFSCIILPNNTKGMLWQEKWEGLGMRGNSSVGLDLNNVRISENQILGEKGDQLWYVFNIVAPYFLMAMAGTYLGVAQSALNEATDHLKKRHYSHSGGNLAENSILQHKLGQLWTKVERTRSLIYLAAVKGDSGDETAVLSIMGSKADVAESAVLVANEALTLVGGIGYRENSRLMRILRDARASHVMAPTTDILLTWIGRSLLDQPLLTD